MSQIYMRDDVLGPNFTKREIKEFIDGASKLQIENPYKDWDHEKVSQKIESTTKSKWRHHHNIDSLKNAPGLYAAYVERVDSMLEMIDEALKSEGLDKRLSKMSAVDLACSEGFVAHHFLRKGLSKIDGFELSDGQINRFHLISSYYKLNAYRIFKMDLDISNLALQLGHTYDIVFCLGIIYHLENPFLFARNLFKITNEVCFVESDTPVTNDKNRFRGGGGVMYLHKDQVMMNAQEVRSLMEIRPDRLALIQILLAAGFNKIEVLEPKESTTRDRLFTSGEKTLLMCTK